MILFSLFDFLTQRVSRRLGPLLVFDLPCHKKVVPPDVLNLGDVLINELLSDQLLLFSLGRLGGRDLVLLLALVPDHV